MLEKFNVIEEIGRFSKLTHKAEPFSRLSLIFARNGYGKSTLCSILRSAAEGNSNYISVRRRLGARKESRVESAWSSGVTVAYSEGKWNRKPSKVYIFDHEYVVKNVHVGDSVTRENKRCLLPVVLGEQGVVLANKVRSLDTEQRLLDEKLKQQSGIIMARCKIPAAKDLPDFCRNEVPADLVEKTRRAGQRVELAKHAAIVKQKLSPSLLKIIKLADAEALLAKSIDGVSEDAHQLVTVHIETQKLGERAHAWLAYGAAHESDKNCPYCGQITIGTPLVEAYRAYFSDAFRALKERVDELSVILDGLGAEKIDELVSINDADFAFWDKLCEIKSAPTLLAEDRNLISDGVRELKNLFRAKQENPLEVISLGPNSASIALAINLLAAYNENIMTHIGVIDQARSDCDVGDLQSLEVVQQKWLAFGEKLNEPVKSAVAVYLDTQKRLDEIKIEKETARGTLKRYTESTMTARQEDINDILSNFAANFQIVDAKTSFVGLEPNTEFAIKIGPNKVKAGGQSDTDPSFKTILSTGDKMTLALAFFIAQVEADDKLTDAIIIFDDPFSSQDMDRQFSTTSYIRSVCTKASQVIVFSHDPRFLQLIEKNSVEGLEMRSFQLQCDNFGCGSVKKWSSTDELDSLYLQQFDLIREYATHGRPLRDQSLNSVKQAIRPFLEDYLRLRFPRSFSDQRHIHNMAKVIQDAGAHHPLAAYVDDLLALNEYTRAAMHGGDDAPAPGELRAQCKKVLNLISSH